MNCARTGITDLENATKWLVDAALGRKKADLVIQNSHLVNVNSGEILEDVDVAIKQGRIVLVGEAKHTIGDDTITIDAAGKYSVPGFLDGHIHIESSMVTLSQFARATLPHGTTTVFFDPHEIANILGLRGVKLMIDESKNLPLKAFATVPSCVPSAPGFETSGAEITISDIERAMRWKEVVGLGEVMNYVGVLNGDKKIHSEIQRALHAGKVVEGHANGLLNKELSAYAAAGITSCHESTRIVDAVQRLRLGMYTMIREGSASKDLSELIQCSTKLGLDTRHMILVTDDIDPDSLVRMGHMDHLVRRSIEEGVDPVKAVQMATLNTAEHFQVDSELGSIAPSKVGDILILDDLEKVRVKTVIASGQTVAQDGQLIVDIPAAKYPSFAKRTVHLPNSIQEEDFEIRVKDNKEVIVRVIGIVEGKITTKHLQKKLKPENGQIQVDVERDIVKVAVLERHKRTGNIGLGFVQGFGLEKGAVASTVAHDSHNMIAIGANDSDLKTAVDVLANCDGGIVAVANNKVLSLVRLRIGGIMSTESVEKVSTQVNELKNAWTSLGCENSSLFMTMSFLALPVIPELRITDLGLVDTCHFRFVNLLINS